MRSKPLFKEFPLHALLSTDTGLPKSMPLRRTKSTEPLAWMAAAKGAAAVPASRSWMSGHRASLGKRNNGYVVQTSASPAPLRPHSCSSQPRAPNC